MSAQSSNMPSYEYKKLRRDSIGSEAYDDGLSPNSHQKRFLFFPQDNKHPFTIVLAVLFLLSLFCNVLLISLIKSLSYDHTPISKYPVTDYLGLRTNIPTPFKYDKISLLDPIWSNPQMSESLGVVAVTSDYIAAKDLPSSIPWPWDDGKSIYILSFHHSIHCLLWIRSSALDPPSASSRPAFLAHMAHCLNILREDIMCHADDTPRATRPLPPLNNTTEELMPGLGQSRMCRDWDGLVEWSTANSACYGNPWKEGAGMEDYYKDCPDGKIFWT